MNARVSETVVLRMAWLRDVVKPARIAGKLGRFLLAGLVISHAVLFLLVLLASLILLHLNPKVTALMVWRGVTAHQKAEPVRFVPLQHIPLVARRMVIKLEDYRFYNHWGIDLGAIRDAYLTDRAIGYPLYGGSTIPQQLARNLFLTPRKTYFRKYTEALIALEMDLFMPKNRILELYLNCIEWGEGNLRYWRRFLPLLRDERQQPVAGRASPPGNHHHQSRAVQCLHVPEEQADAGALWLPAEQVP